MKDPEVLGVAASVGKILVTHDVRTMPRHFGEFIAHSESPGLILVPGTMPMAQAIEEILRISFFWTGFGSAGTTLAEPGFPGA
jgi:hypothetical protein